MASIIAIDGTSGVGKTTFVKKQNRKDVLVDYNDNCKLFPLYGCKSTVSSVAGLYALDLQATMTRLNSEKEGTIYVDRAPFSSILYDTLFESTSSEPDPFDNACLVRMKSIIQEYAPILKKIIKGTKIILLINTDIEGLTKLILYRRDHLNRTFGPSYVRAQNYMFQLVAELCSLDIYDYVKYRRGEYGEHRKFLNEIWNDGYISHYEEIKMHQNV